MMFPLFYINPLLPFLVGGCFCFVTAIAVYFHPIDLTLEALDNLDENRSEVSSKSTELTQL